MAIQVVSPRVGWCRETLLKRWLAEDGDWVSAGQPICLLESEHRAVPVVAMQDGFFHVHRPLVRPGTRLAWGTPLGFLLVPGMEPSPAPHKPPARPPRRPCRVRPPALDASARPQRPDRGPRISPRARRLVRSLGLAPATLKGTGSGGRIREADVRRTLPKSRARVAAFPGEVRPDKFMPPTVAEMHRWEGLWELQRNEIPKLEPSPSDSTSTAARPTPQALPATWGLERLLWAVARAVLDNPGRTGVSSWTLEQTLPLHVLWGDVGDQAPRELWLEVPGNVPELTSDCVRKELSRAAGGGLGKQDRAAAISIVDLAGWSVDSFTPPIPPGMVAALGAGTPRPLAIPVSGKLQLRWCRHLVLVTAATRIDFWKGLQLFQNLQRHLRATPASTSPQPDAAP
jgi:hypothetical protein